MYDRRARVYEDTGIYVNSLRDLFKLKSEELRGVVSIFKDPSVFDLNAVPRRIYERKELFTIAERMAEYGVLGIPNNFVLYGPRGSGKTISVLHLLDILKEHGLRTFYVKARECPTSYHIYRAIAGAVKSGYHTSELRERALEKCREKSVVVVDEADFLEDFDFLYHLTRSTRASIMLLAQNVQVSKRIDDATYSSFLPTKVYFKEYGADELYQILRMRAEDGLNEWDDATLKLVAAVVARDYRGDARIAIRALFRVAMGSAWRDEERARTAVAEASREVEEMSLRELKDHDLLVLYAVSKVRETNKAYNVFNEYARTVQHRAYSKTAFFRALNHLQNLGLITQVKKRVGRYFTIEVDLLIDEKMVGEEVKKRFEEL